MISSIILSKYLRSGWCYLRLVVLLTEDLTDAVMASMPVSSVVDFMFGQTKNYKISIYCYSTKHTVFKSESRD